jgi:hypothetical protein
MLFPVVYVIISVLLGIQVQHATPEPPSPEDYPPFSLTFDSRLVDFYWMPNTRNESNAPFPAIHIPALMGLSEDDHFHERWVFMNPNSSRQIRADTWMQDNSLWWMYGNSSDSERWFMNVRPNSEQETIESLHQRIVDNDRTLRIPSQQVRGNESCVAHPYFANDKRDPIAPMNTSPIYVELPQGEGWGMITACLAVGWWAGHGPECGGFGITYSLDVWYTFHGILTDTDRLVSISVPLVIQHNPYLEGGNMTCIGDDPILYDAPSVSVFDGLKWVDLHDDSGAQLTLESEVMFYRSAFDTLMQNEHLGMVLEVLNTTFATLTFNLDWLDAQVNMMNEVN